MLETIFSKVSSVPAAMMARINISAVFEPCAALRRALGIFFRIADAWAICCGFS